MLAEQREEGAKPKRFAEPVSRKVYDDGERKKPLRDSEAEHVRACVSEEWECVSSERGAAAAAGN